MSFIIISPVTDSAFLSSGLTIHLSAEQYTALGHMFCDAMNYCESLKEAHLTHADCVIPEVAVQRIDSYQEITAVIDAAIDSQHPHYLADQSKSQAKKTGK